MSLFEQILTGDTERDLYDNPDPYGNDSLYGRRQNFRLPDEVKRRVIQDVQPEVEGKSVMGFLGNAAEDVSHMASGFGAILGQALVHPIKSAEAVGRAAVHPVDTAHMFVDPLVDKYTPGKDESIPAMLLRNAYDHPFDTLVDASFIVGGPASVAGKIAKATGFERTAALMNQVAERAALIDPITQAQKAGMYILKSKFPDAFARLRTSSSLADAAAAETTKQDWLVNDFNTRAQEAHAHLNPAEMAIRFPYLEGRIQLNPFDNTMSELTHTGARETTKVAEGTAIRPDALDLFAQKYSALQQEYEVAAKISPEQVAAQAAANHERKIGDMLAENPEAKISKSPEQVYQEAFDEATQRSQKRAAKSTLTALDAAKDSEFKGRVAKANIDQQTFDLKEIEGMLPRAQTTTLQEALDVMGPKGGIIVPHSMEVMSHDQSTIGNILGKVGEANVYKENTGTLFRNGMLKSHDPVAALSRYYRAAVRGDTFATITEQAMQDGIKNGLDIRPMHAGWNPNLDADVRAGTHQPLHVPSMHLEGNIQEHYEKLTSRLMEVADNPGVKDLNVMDVAKAMAKASDETFPLRPDAGGYYKIPKSVGDELKFYKQSFEPATNPWAQMSDRYMMQPYNMFNLSAKAGRIVNNGFGNTGQIMMQGLHPFSIRGWDAMLTMGRATLGKAGVLKDEVSQKLAGVFDLPGVPGGLGRTQPFQEVRGLSAKLAASKNPLLSTFGKYTEKMASVNENLEHLYRTASTIYELKPGGLESVRNLIHSSASMATFADRINELTKMGVHAIDEPQLAGAVKGMNRFLNDYGRTTAFERRIGRHVFPYHKFYKHSAELLIRFPFEAPVKARLARGIGNAALQDAKDELKSYGYDWNTMVPEFMRDSIPMKVTNSPDGTPAVLMFNTKGVNPFSFLAGHDVGEQGIGALHPLAKIAIEQATGVNLFTREKFQGKLSTFSGRKIDQETGAIVEDYNRPNIVEHYLRQFWPYQTLRDIVAHGRVATDTADLLDLMGSGAPGAYQLDDRGLQRRKPQPLGAMTPVARMFGTVPQVLQMPTKAQVAGRAAIGSSQLADLMQQHPEARERIMASMRANLNAWRPNAQPTGPRRF